jgi:ribonuclease Z
MRWEAIEELEIWGGAFALERVRDLLFGVVLRGGKPPIRLNLIPIESGTLFEQDSFRVEAFPVAHRGPGCFGFAFEEPTRQPFLVEEAEALGVPPGPMRRELVAGNPVILPDGRTVRPDQVLGPLRRGTRLVHVGDCAKTEGLLEVTRDADALVIEATYLDIEASLAAEFGHLTAKQAASLAAEAGIGQLFLTHISRRYHDRDVFKEASAIFPHVTVARDFDRHEIRKPD